MTNQHNLYACFILAISFILTEALTLTTSNVNTVFKNYDGKHNIELQITGTVKINSLLSVKFKNGSMVMKATKGVKISCTEPNAGFRFFGRGTINVTGITFSNCGSQVAAAVVLFNMNATFQHCTFMDNSASGINAIDSNISIQNSTFLRNNAQNVAKKFKDGFVFGKTNIGGAIGIMFHNGSHHRVEIKNCAIRENSAFVKNSKFTSTHPTKDKKRILSNYFTLGGGISILHAFNSNNNTVVIADSVVEKNSATYGGGIFVTNVHNATDNKVFLSNLIISKNYVTQTGGGFIFSNWDYSHRNFFKMVNTIVKMNQAMMGGGTKLIQNNRHPNRESFRSGTVTIEIHKTVFTQNIAKSASAIRLLFNQPIGFVAPVIPVFKDCIIETNYPDDNSREYLGAVISSRLGLVLTGRSTIQNNYGGSAIYISQAELHVKGYISFLNNRGKFGGAIYVADISRIVMYPKSELCFHGNKADISGGALYVESSNFVETMYPYNPGCFLQYCTAKTPPSEWNAKLTFVNNSATEKGAAIYISTLLHCQWSEDEALGYQSYEKSLRWNTDVFTYTGNYLELASLSKNNKKLLNAKVDIATDTYEYQVQKKQNFEVAPGEPFLIKLSAADQLNHTVYSIPLLRSIERSKNGDEKKDDVFFIQHVVLTPEEAFTKLSVKIPNKETYEALTSNESKQHIIEISDTTSDFTATKYLNIQTLKCHPGFHFKDGSCICDEIEGIKRCTDGRYIHLKEGYWAGVVNGKFVTYLCPRNYCSCNTSKDKDVIEGTCLYDYQTPNNICIEGRNGILCGQCNKGLSLGLQNSECRDCKGTGWVFSFSIILIIVLTCVVIYFNVSIPAELRSVLFYVQVLPYVFTQHDKIGAKIHFITGIVDIGRLSEFPLGKCAMPGLGNLESVAISYVTPVTVLLVMFVVYLLKKRIKWTANRPFQRFFVLFTFMYKYFTETSFSILHCVNMSGKEVFYYDGNVECKTGHHFVLFIIAYIVISVCVVIPVVMIPFIVSGKIHRIWRFNLCRMGVVDSFTEGYRRDVSNPVGFSRILADKGWWWSYDLSRRAILIGIYVFIDDTRLKQIMLSFTCLIFLIIHSVSQPYEDVESNTIESWFLFALAAVTILQPIEDLVLRHTLTIVILIATYGCGMYFLFVKIYIYFWRLRHPPRKESQQSVVPARVNEEIGVHNNGC